jgi:hypothetical protein
MHNNSVLLLRAKLINYSSDETVHDVNLYLLSVLIQSLTDEVML